MDVLSAVLEQAAFVDVAQFCEIADIPGLWEEFVSVSG